MPEDEVKLNREQKWMANTLDENMVVIAGAGSGKTLSMVKRYNNLIDSGVEPEKIIFTTFGKEASEEIEERVDVDPDNNKLNIGTIHSLCRQIIRQEYKETDYSSSPNTKVGYGRKKFIDDIIEEYMGEEGYSKKDYDLRDDIKFVVLKNIDAERRKANFPEEAEPSFDVLTQEDKNKIGQFTKVKKLIENNFSDIYSDYLDEMHNKNVMDYGQMIFEVWNLLKENEDVRENYAENYEHIMVDEAQDLNQIQYDIFKYLSGGENLVLVGDSAQCLPENEQIEILEDDEVIKKNISNVEVGDKVLTAKSNGNYGYCEVSNKMSKPSKGKIEKYTTESGKEIRVTPDHEMFARVPSQDSLDHEIYSNIYYTYLMKSANGRWRIGTTSDLASRLNIEGSARGIIPIESYESKGEALYHEKVYSKRYEIPTTVFENRQLVDDNSPSTMKEKWRDKLYETLDCDVVGLANDLDLDLQTFAKVKNGNTFGRTNTLNINLRMSTREQSAGSMAHRLNVATMNEEYQEKIRKIDDLNESDGRKETTRWRKWNQDLDYLSSKANEIAEKTGGYVVQKFNPVDGRKNALVVPSKNIVEGMKIPVREDGEVIFETITSKEKIDYDGKVYDLEVPKTNIFGNSEGIFVHNCIYGFRGSNPKLMHQFKEEFDATKIIFEKNYRSYQEIVNVFNNVNSNLEVAENKSLIADKGHNENGNSDPVIKEMTPREVAEEVVHLVEDGYDMEEIAILGRTNRDIEDYQQELERLSIPTRNAGNDNFNESWDINKAYGYLRGVMKNDGPAARSLMKNRNVYNITKVEEEMDEDNLMEYLRNLDLNPDEFSKKKARKLREDIKFIDRLDEDGIFEEIENKKFNKRGFTDNVEAMEDIYRSLGKDDFFDYMEIDREDTVTISTVHQAKGKEWDVVFLVNVDEGSFPREDNPEEARIFYVGCSRPREKLYMTYQKSPSEFLGWVGG